MPGRGSQKLITARGLSRWGAGGASVEQVHVGEPAPDGQTLDVDIVYATAELERAVFAIGIIDEAGNEIGGSASPVGAVQNSQGRVSCTIERDQLRPGSDFLVGAILTEDGGIRYGSGPVRE